MLSYWILRDRNGRPIGLVKTENGRCAMHLNAPLSAEWMLFSDSDAVPIEPDREAALQNANALIGMRDGQVVGFAAGSGAESLGYYRLRMSQICTKKEEASAQKPEQQPQAAPEPDPEPEPEPEPAAQGSEEVRTVADPPIETADDSAQRAARFSLLLQHADAFYARFDRQTVEESMVQKEDNEAPKRGIDLFPQAFAGAHWRYVDGADVLPHYEGLKISPNGERTRILAVRGKAAPRPPRSLAGFSRFLRGSDGNGYWVRILPG